MTRLRLLSGRADAHWSSSGRPRRQTEMDVETILPPGRIAAITRLV